MKPEIRCCLVPDQLDNPKEAELYRRIRDTILRGHCADGRDAHRCVGRVTLDREGITLSCARCGDARQLLTQEDRDTANQQRGGADGQHDPTTE